jgi:hypothetical protein
MKALYSILASFAICILLTSCQSEIEGEGTINLHDVKIQNFENLYLEIPAHVIIEDSDSTTCAIACQDNIFNEINVHNKNKKLVVESNKKFKVQRPVEIRITVPKVDYIDITGNGTVEYNPTKYLKKLGIELKGKSSVISTINAGELNIAVIDNGDAVLAGKVEALEGMINGSGDINAYDLVAEKCKLEINGSGNVRCSPSTLLKATIHGSGNIYYRGTPEIKSEITGSGQIKRESK